jgi:cold shock CspA family protein
MNISYQGVILFYLPDKGYGYVRIPGTREEFHFRKENLLQPVQAGDHVRFQLKQQRNGYFVDQIELLNLV